MVKKYFVTGLVLLLPLVITIVIVFFLINLLTKPFLGLVTAIFNHYGLFNKPFFFLSPEEVVLISSKLLILIAIVIITIAVGFFGHLFLVRMVGRMGEFFLHRIPIVSKIYISVKDAITTIFSKKKTSFSTVVLVPFPHSGMRSLGLITRCDMPSGSTLTQDKVSVFVPGTPNPTMGFMLLFNKDELIITNLKVDDALKFIISCGVINPGFTVAPTEDVGI